MHLVLLAIKKLNESGVLGTTATRIRNPTDISHQIALDNVFIEVTEVGTIEEKSYYIYN